MVVAVQPLTSFPRRGVGGGATPRPPQHRPRPWADVTQPWLRLQGHRVENPGVCPDPGTCPPAFTEKRLSQGGDRAGAEGHCPDRG